MKIAGCLGIACATLLNPNAVGNTPPVIEPITDVLTYAGTSGAEVTLHLHDAESALDDLKVVVDSLNPDLVLKEGLSLSDAGEFRTLTIRPRAGRTGAGTITIAVTDSDGAVATSDFVFTVANTPDVLRIGPILPVRCWRGGPEVRVAFSVEWSGTGGLTVAASSSDPGLFPGSAVSVLPIVEGRGTVGVIPPIDRGGAAVITVTAWRAGIPWRAGITNSTRFPVIVDEPAFESEKELLFRESDLRAVSVADFDGDGAMDVVTAGGSTVRIARQTGNSFVEVVSRPFGSDVYQLNCVDADGDGRIDLFLRGRNRMAVWLNRELGGGWALEPVAFPSVQTPPTAESTCWGEFDGRGDVDLLVVDDAARLHLISKESGKWVDSERLNPGIRPPMSAADQDGDGDQDLLAASTYLGDGQSGIRIWQNSGGGRFDVVSPALSDGVPIRLGWTDIDNDDSPNPWAIVRGREGEGRLIVWRKVAGTWTESGHYPWSSALVSTLPGKGYQVLWADFDADGTMDLVFQDGLRQPFQREGVLWRQFRVLFGNGISSVGFGLSDSSSLLLNPYPTGVANLDILVAGAGSVSLMSNASHRLNLPPFAPTGLRASVTGDRIRFDWSAAWDAEQTEGLTYNLRVGTVPGGNDIIASMSRKDGYRLLPESGNCGTRLFREIEVPRDHRALFWSVQAIDSSLAGGAFASEERVEVGLPMADSVTLRVGRLGQRIELTGETTGMTTVWLQRSFNLHAWETILHVAPTADGRFAVTMWADSRGGNEMEFFRAVPMR